MVPSASMPNTPIHAHRIIADQSLLGEIGLSVSVPRSSHSTPATVPTSASRSVVSTDSMSSAPLPPTNVSLKSPSFVEDAIVSSRFDESHAGYCLAPHHADSAGRKTKIPNAADVFYAANDDETNIGAQETMFLAEGCKNELDLLISIPDIEVLFDIILGALELVAAAD